MPDWWNAWRISGACFFGMPRSLHMSTKSYLIHINTYENNV